GNIIENGITYSLSCSQTTRCTSGQKIDGRTGCGTVGLFFPRPKACCKIPILQPTEPTCPAGFAKSAADETCVPPGGGGSENKKCVLPIIYNPKSYNSEVHGKPGSGHGYVRCGSGFCAVDLGPGVDCQDSYEQTKKGIDVYSPISGKVIEVFSLSYGSCVIIDNEIDNKVVLCHIKPSINNGDHVNTGDKIGSLTSYRCGSNSMGPHLHFELMLNKKWISDDGKEGTWEAQKKACNDYN
ncbi:M23 family metallopeptidase, partial [Candidatus Pacearchaeota archaeon]|nr:M23 family metallopeptidase [Candidatus Pacearchaeota archaeon]